MLEDYQTFSIDCKKVIEILCKTQNFCNNNNKMETDGDFIDEKEYAYKCLECGANWPFSNDNALGSSADSECGRGPHHIEVSKGGNFQIHRGR